MKTMGLDLSSKSTGVSIFDEQNLIHYECITAGSSNLFKRIDKMIVELRKIIEQYKVEYVYIEDVIPSDVKNNQSVFKALTYLQGFVLHLLDEYNLNYTFFTASEWRAKCGIHTGRGIKRESLKKADVEFVKAQFGISVNDDVADSIAICFAGLGLKPTTPQTIVTSDGFEFA